MSERKNEDGQQSTVPPVVSAWKTFESTRPDVTGLRTVPESRSDSTMANHKWQGEARKRLKHELLKEQGGCKICDEPLDIDDRRTVLDHCHECDEVRGVLCGSCNIGLGLLLDDPGLLRRAADYLEQTDPCLKGRKT